MSSTQTERNPSGRSLLKRGLGYLFAAGGLIWVFHDVHPNRLLETIRVDEWWLVALAIALDILTYIFQGLRWKLLLSPVGKISGVRATQAIYAGLFANEIAPMRLGELVRAYLASRWLPAGIRPIIPSMIVERFFDAFWLAAGFGVAALFVSLPKNLMHVGDALGAIVLGATVLFVYVVFRKRKTVSTGTSQWRVFRFLNETLRELLTGLQEIGFSRKFYLAAALSLAMLAFQAASFWLIMLASSLKVTVVTGVIVYLIERLGTAIPNAPANVGSYQFFTVLGLTMFGVEKSAAAGFSVVAFVILTIPLWVIGFLAVSYSGMSLSKIRAELVRLRVREVVSEFTEPTAGRNSASSSTN